MIRHLTESRNSPLLTLAAGIIFLLLTGMSTAQSVAVNNDGSLPNASAMLDVKSSNKGLLIPRVALTSTQDNTTIPSPQISVLIYNTNTNGIGVTAVSPGYYYWNGTEWLRLIVSGNTNGSGWLLGGNSGTNSAIQFLGTVDFQPLIFKVNNTQAGRLDSLNVFFGYKTGSSNTTGYSNTAVGAKALHQNTIRSNLVAVGDSALYNNGIGASGTLDGIQNTAIGSQVLFSNTTGFFNTGVGYQSLRNNTTANGNTGVGWNSLYYNSTGFDNTAVGVGSMFENINGFFNTAIGASSLGANWNGHNNAAVGRSALGSNRSGNYNVVFGSEAMLFNTTGKENSASGFRALHNNTTGSFNVAFGFETMFSNLTAYSNVAIGKHALYRNNRSNIVAIGDSALHHNGFGATLPVHATGNTAIGSKSLYTNTTGSYNSALGFETLQANSSGYANTALGYHSLMSNTTGITNTANGFESLMKNVSGNENTATGQNSMHNNISGHDNAAFGNFSLGGNTSGSDNTAVGHSALSFNATGSRNTALGFNANVPTNNLNNASAIGALARVDCSNCMVLGSVNSVNGAASDVNVGVGNTNPRFPLSFKNALGDKISFWNDGGPNSYGIGVQGSLLQIYTDVNYGAVAFGYGNSAAFTETMRSLGNGRVGIGSTAPEASLEIKRNSGFSPSLPHLQIYENSPGGAAVLRFESDGTIYHWDISMEDNPFQNQRLDFIYDSLGRNFSLYQNGNAWLRGTLTQNSDARLKTRIEPITSSLSSILQLNGYRYQWKNRALDQSIQVGLLAQEVQKIFPELVKENSDGELAVNYSGMIPLLINAIKEQQQQIETQQQQIDDLKKLVKKILHE